MVSNYRRGYEVERRAIEVLKKYAKCFVAQRTAGSHSLIDVFGLNEFSYAYFIQLKRYKKKPSDVSRTLEKYKPPFSVLAGNVIWMVWFWIDRKGWLMFRYDPSFDNEWVEIEPCEKSYWGFLAKGYCEEVEK